MRLGDRPYLQEVCRPQRQLEESEAVYFSDQRQSSYACEGRRTFYCKLRIAATEIVSTRFGR